MLTLCIFPPGFQKKVLNLFDFSGLKIKRIRLLTQFFHSAIWLKLVLDYALKIKIKDYNLTNQNKEILVLFWLVKFQSSMRSTIKILR